MGKLTNEIIEDLNALAEKRDEKFFSWLRHLLLMASGLLGILVSLHSKQSQNNYTHVLFSLTVLLLGVGILCGCIALYADVQITTDRFVKTKKLRLKQLNPSDFSAEDHVTNRHKIFDISEAVCYISLSLSIISLVLYAINID